MVSGSGQLRDRPDLPPVSERLLTPQEAADRLGTTIRYVRRLTQENRIRFVRFPGKIRIPERALDELIAGGTKQQASPTRPVPGPVVRRDSRVRRFSTEESRLSRRRFGAVRQLASGRWQASYVGPDGLRRSHSSTFPTKIAAERWLVLVESEVMGGSWRDPTPGRQLLCVFTTQWIAERGLRPRTVDLYTWLARNYIEPSVGRLPLARLTTSEIRTWYSGLQTSGVSQSVASKAYRLLRAVLNTAVADNAIARNPCQIKGAGFHEAAERPVLSLAQVIDLQASFPDQLRVMVALATYGGLRYGEIIAQRRGDIDVADHTVTVQFQYVERSTGEMLLGPPKSRAGTRTVRLPAVAMRTVIEHLDRHVGPDPDALLVTGTTGKPLRRSGFNRAVNWKQLVSALGVPQLHFDDLRHTGNTLAAGTPGTSTRDLMERMGHDSMRAALIYQHATRDADRRIAASFDAQVEALTSAVQPACNNGWSRVVSDSDSNSRKEGSAAAPTTPTKADK